MDLTPDEATELIRDIATRAGTARELAKRYGCTVAELRRFTETYRDEIEAYAEAPQTAAIDPTPTELADLWITNKFERLRRIQAVADATLEVIQSGGVDQALLREYRSYLALAANELGQLLHRGSGESAEGETLAVVFEDVDMDSMK
jgi:hypothetical protein